MDPNTESELVYDWGLLGAQRPSPFGVVDESPRDGLQSPSVLERPSIRAIIEQIQLMDQLGIEYVNVGLPVTPKAVSDIIEIIKEMNRQNLKIKPQVACRTVIKDIAPVVEITDATGVRVEVCTFIGSSSIRIYAEDWKVTELAKLSEGAVRFCVENDLPVKFVTEDTIRAHPDTLRTLFNAALVGGTEGLIICDTVGGATPAAVRGLVNFVKACLKAHGLLNDVTIDWHGHNDLGQGLECAFAAVAAGVHNVHGTVLGIGERAGNVPMELLLINSNYRGHRDRNLSSLARYVEQGSRMTGLPVPQNYPCFGSDVLTTQTGVHAAAQLKALDKGDRWLEDAVYSAVPASAIGRHHQSAIGPMSGRANVIWYCKTHGLAAPTQDQIDKVLEVARNSGRILSDESIQILLALQ